MQTTYKALQQQAERMQQQLEQATARETELSDSQRSLQEELSKLRSEHQTSVARAEESQQKVREEGGQALGAVGRSGPVARGRTTSCDSKAN